MSSPVQPQTYAHDPGDDRQDSHTPHYHRDSQLFLDDGNIVLVAESTTFRVHRGVLAMHSAVFNDMFSVSQNKDGSEDTLYGLPAVRMSDSEDDIRHLLKAMYGIKYFRKRTHTSCEMFGSLTRMTTKYMVDDLRKDLVDHLTFLFPMTVALLSRGSALRRRAGSSLPIHAVNLGRTCEIPQILPAAFFFCCQLDLQHILYGIEEPLLGGLNVQLSVEDMRVCIRGREMLYRCRCSGLKSLFSIGSVAANCTGRGRCHIARLRDQFASEARNVTEFFDPSKSLCSLLNQTDDGPLASLCTACQTAWRVSETAWINKVWDEMPETFGLPDWYTYPLPSLTLEDET